MYMYNRIQKSKGLLCQNKIWNIILGWLKHTRMFMTITFVTSLFKQWLPGTQHCCGGACCVWCWCGLWVCNGVCGLTLVGVTLELYWCNQSKPSVPCHFWLPMLKNLGYYLWFLNTVFILFCIPVLVDCNISCLYAIYVS